MQVGEMIVAGGVIALCAVLLLRLALGERRRERFDGALRRAWQRYPLRVWHAWQRSRERRRRDRLDAVRREADQRLRQSAEDEARQLIARARERAGARPGSAGGTPPEVEREGNVLRPKAFRKAEPGTTQPGSDTLH